MDSDTRLEPQTTPQPLIPAVLYEIHEGTKLYGPRLAAGLPSRVRVYAFTFSMYSLSMSREERTGLALLVSRGNGST